MVLGVWTDGFCTKTVTLRDLTRAALLKVRKGIFGMVAGRERNVLGEEKNSFSFKGNA